jgi:hypothetical protein
LLIVELTKVKLAVKARAAIAAREAISGKNDASIVPELVRVGDERELGYTGEEAASQLSASTLFT